MQVVTESMNQKEIQPEARKCDPYVRETKIECKSTKGGNEKGVGEEPPRLRTVSSLTAILLPAE